jgi:integrase
VKDIDFDHLTAIVREGKGGKDRAVMMPQALKEGLRMQLAYSQSLWALDRSHQRNGVEMPYALEKKYPKAGSS